MARSWTRLRPDSRRRRDRSRRPAFFDVLEDRSLLSTFTWMGQVDGNFNDPARWMDQNGAHGVPGSGDDARTPGTSYTVTVTGSATVNSFFGDGAALDVSGGVFTVNNTRNAATSTVNNLTVAPGAAFHTGGTTTTMTGAGVIGGNLDVATGATLDLAGSAASINLNAGNSLTGAGIFVIVSNLSVKVATTAPRNVILNSGNSIGLTGPGTFTVPSGGTFEWRSGYMFGVGGATTIAAGATLKIDGTGSKTLGDRALNNAGSGTWSDTGNWFIDRTGLFANSGSFTVQNDQSIAQSPTEAKGSIVNSGTWTKTSPTGTGTTDIAVPFNNTGGQVVAQTGVLQLDNNGTSSGTFNVPSAAGTLWITGIGYSLNAGTSFTGPGTVHLTSGFLGADLVHLNGNVTVPNLAIDAGAITGPGSLTVTGTLSINSGTISTTGTLTLPQGSTLAMAGTNVATFDTGTFNIAATTTLSGSESFGLTGGATFNNFGSFTIQNDTVGSNLLLNLGSTGTLVNAGIITKTSPTSSGSTTIENGHFINRGTVNVVTGRLLLDVGGTSTGAFLAAAGGTIDFASSWNLNAGTTMAGAGNFGIGIGFFGYGTVAINGTISAPNFNLPGGILTTATATATTFTVARLNWTDGTINGTGTVAIPSGGTLAIGGAANKFLSRATLGIAGTATWTGTGNLGLDSGAVLENRPGGVINATNDQLLGGGSGGTFNNAGAFNKSSLTGVGTTTINIAFNNLPGGAINLNSGNLSTGSLINVGSINLASQTDLIVGGNFIQPNAGTLTVAVGGAPATRLFGEIQVAGAASLNGTLNVNRANNLTPTVGQTFPILTYGSASGNFTTVRVPNNGIAPLFGTILRPTEFDLIGFNLIRPSAPTGLTLLPADDTGGPGRTAVHRPHLTGHAQPGLLVQIFDGVGNLIGSAFADASGSFTVTPDKALAPATYSLKAVAIDTLGNYGASGSPFLLTITPPPLAPTGLTLLPADDTNGPGRTSVRRPRLTGFATPGLLVQVFDGSGHLIASAFAGSNGSYTTPPIVAQAPGSYSLKAVAIDAGGNYGAVGSPFALTIL